MDADEELKAKGKPAAMEDCACCHAIFIVPGASCEAEEERDTALVASFLGGVIARDRDVPIGVALCEKHGALAEEALRFLLAGKVER